MGFLTLLCACRAPEAPPPPAPVAAHGPLPFLPPVAEVEHALWRGLPQPSPEVLNEARQTLQHVLAARPGTTYARHLLAWVERLAGDEAAEARALAGAPADRAHVYAHFFTRPPAALAPLLAANLAAACRVPGAPMAWCAELPAVEPPADHVVFEQISWVAHGADRMVFWSEPGLKPPPPRTARELGLALGLAPGMSVADVGAGEGWFTLPFAQLVAPGGAVHATEVHPAFLDFIDASARAQGIAGVYTHLVDGPGTGLPPDSVDLLFVCEVMKAIVTNAQLDDPEHVEAQVRPFFESARRAARPGARLVLIEHEDPAAPPKGIQLERLIPHAEAAGFGAPRALDLFGPRKTVLVLEALGT